MSLALGSLDIENLKLGSVQVSKAYLGSTLVWEYSAPSTSVTFSITPTPSNANVSLTSGSTTVSGTGTQTITINAGDTVSYTVSASGYTSKSGSVVVTNDTDMLVSLDTTMATITFLTNAPNPTITLKATGYSQQGNSITVPVGTRVDYIVSASGYVTRQSAIYADTDKTYEIILTEDSTTATLTISAKPSSSSISISATGYETVSGNGIVSITVAKDTPVQYTVSYGSEVIQTPDAYPLYVSNDMLIEYDMTKEHVCREFSFRKQDAPTDPLIGTFIYSSSEGTMVVGPTNSYRMTPLFLPKNETVYLTYHTPECAYTSGSSATYTSTGATTYSLRVNKILTVNYTPTDAVVEVVDGAGNTVPPISETPGKNTYYFPFYHNASTSLYSNTCTITVSRSGYTSKSATATRSYSSDGSVTVNL